MNGMASERTTLAVTWLILERTSRLSLPTAYPIANAASTAHKNSPTTTHSDTETPTAATAERRSTSAEASLSMLSPWSTVTIRGGTPDWRTMLVATASVGLMIAPKAIPIPSGTPGMAALRRKPIATAVTTTRVTEKAEISRKSLRNSIAGVLTAAEYSSGGRTPASTHSGLIVTASTNGSRLTAKPNATSSSGGAIPTLGASAVTATTSTTPMMATSPRLMVSNPPIPHRGADLPQVPRDAQPRCVSGWFASATRTCSTCRADIAGMASTAKNAASLASPSTGCGSPPAHWQRNTWSMYWVSSPLL